MWTERRVTSSLAILFLVLLFGFLLLPVPSYGGSLSGHLVGISGTLVMVYTLVYPFRKRALGKKGKQNPLKHHIYAGLIGPSLVVVHSSHSYASLNATIAFLAMVVIVLSGLAGRYLLRKIGKSEKNLRRDISLLREELKRKKAQIDTHACAAILEPEEAAEEFGTDISIEPVETEKCEEMVALAEAVVDNEAALQGFSKTKALFKKWLRVHIYLTAFLFAMIAVHVLSTIYYGLRWLP